MDFFAFSHGFQHKKFDFHSETTRTPFGLPTRNLYECRADFSKVRLLCFFKSGKNNKLGSVTKIPEVLYERFKRIFSKGLDIGFFQRCLRRFTKMLSKRQQIGSGIKEKTAKHWRAF
jgi:hypothetical protein